MEARDQEPDASPSNLRHKNQGSPVVWLVLAAYFVGYVYIRSHHFFIPAGGLERWPLYCLKVLYSPPAYVDFKLTGHRAAFTDDRYIIY